ncbi:MAG: phosphoesterase, partial [Actinomycetota bacterium]
GPGLLTVGEELNKLAANIAIGRNGAGVHWRSDYTESVKLGEQIAIGILQEQKATYLEDHHLSLTKFDGTAIII